MIEKIYYTTFLIFLMLDTILYIENDILAFSILIIGSFIFLMVSFVAKKIDGVKAVFIIVVGIILLTFTANFLIDYLENLTKQKGSKIIFALEQYYNEIGFLPDSLKQLKPNYLDEIPIPKNKLLSTRFNYQRLNDNNYAISFKGSAFTRYVYERTKGRWERRD